MNTISSNTVNVKQDVEGGKFLSFFLGKEEYAIEILRVQEIIGLLPIVPVPKMPEYIRGIINLRGNIVPIMCIRKRFHLPVVPDTPETCIVVVQHNGKHMGIVVDKVSEVVDVKAELIEDVPDFGQVVSSDYLMGIAKSKQNVRMLLDLAHVVYGE